MKTWAVIPAYEAAQTIAKVINDLKPFVSEIVVVDDGSQDSTFAEAAKTGVKVLRHIVNRGYGAALVTGQEYALQNGAEAVVHFDADGQFDAADVAKLLAALQPGVPSVALGSRFLGKAIAMPALRKFTLRLAIIFTWATTGLKLTDAHNGLRAFTAEALRPMKLRQARMAVSSEIVQEIVRLNLPYTEVPVTVTYTAESLRGSKQGRLPAVKIVKDLFVGRFLR
jgi:glycosyltransferase involved in cell wall biosynthesis